MHSRYYFPLGIAAGEAFCNRKKETELLIENIQHGKHTLLMASRRYGKSSLSLHALSLAGLPYVEVDFYMASNEKAVESYILNSVSELIGQALGPIDKLLTSIKRYAQKLKPRIEIDASVFKLALTPDLEHDPASNVKEALLLLEQLLTEKKQRAVFLMNEFQTVGVLARGQGVEGAIRHVAQKTKYLTLIFSGSNRALLKNMFDDATRPLYKLCWQLALARITDEHYNAHLQKAAKTAWNKRLDTPVLNEILLLTERHPYYVNKLCDRIWAYYKNQPPSIKEVQQEWSGILAEEKSDAIREISLLSPGQKRMLLQIARGTIPQLTSKQAMLALEMTSSSILAALEALEEKDVVEKLGTHYHIINPIIRFYVSTTTEERAHHD